ncbi:MAG: phosphoribosyltransferase family protein [Saprospiraceae bacterium]|nr:phosphoribosyltransferase family protein [Saprospiraceae bacterium]
MKAMDLPAFDVVLGIGRGGIVPASMLAHQLKCDLKIVNLNYRDDENHPRFDEPRLKGKSQDLRSISGTVLIVDDVSVSGKTLSTAKSLLSNCQVSTLVCKGEADFVLFPEVRNCVNWPWKTSLLTIASEEST